MAEQAKEIDRIEILHLDVKGYGPEGKHTRREWRAECLENLLAGKEKFLAWQKSWRKIKKNTLKANFEVHRKDSDEIKSNYARQSSSYTLDFAGYKFLLSSLCEYEFLIDCIFDFSSFDESEISFVNSTFKGFAKFNYAEFKGFAWFQDCKFKDDVRFNSAIFRQVAYFKNVEFCSIAGFYNTKFMNQADFMAANFKSDVLFANSSFFGVGCFKSVLFSQKFPSFSACTLDKTQLEFSNESLFPQNDYSEDAIKSISFLKRLSDENGQTDQALNFNAMELRAKRKNTWQTLSPDKAWLNLLSLWPLDQIFIDSLWKMLVWLSVIFSSQFWFCVFTYLYEKISDFGRSFTKPLFYLVILFCASYLFGVVSAFENSPAKFTYSRQPIFEELARVYDYNQPKKPLEYLKISAYRAATEYSLYRSGNFLDFTDADKNTVSVNMRLFGSEIEPWWARVFGFIKGIATAILLFLIALGLRNKYRVS